MQRATVFLSEPQRKQLDTLVRATGTAASAHIRRALDQYLASPEIKFVLDHAQREAERRAAGVPFPSFDDVENSIMFRYLDEGRKQRIRAAATDMEKRQLLVELMDEFVSESA